MKWDEVLLYKCRELMNKGGEIHIQFSQRSYKGVKVVVPIIKEYPDNQIICDEVKIKDID